MKTKICKWHYVFSRHEKINVENALIQLRIYSFCGFSTSFWDNSRDNIRNVKRNKCEQLFLEPGNVITREEWHDKNKPRSQICEKMQMAPPGACNTDMQWLS